MQQGKRLTCDLSGLETVLSLSSEKRASTLATLKLWTSAISVAKVLKPRAMWALVGPQDISKKKGSGGRDTAQD